MLVPCVCVCVCVRNNLYQTICTLARTLTISHSLSLSLSLIRFRARAGTRALLSLAHPATNKNWVLASLNHEMIPVSSSPPSHPPTHPPIHPTSLPVVTSSNFSFLRLLQHFQRAQDVKEREREREFMRCDTH
jgi:hypothetical protein